MIFLLTQYHRATSYAPPFSSRVFSGGRYAPLGPRAAPQGRPGGLYDSRWLLFSCQSSGEGRARPSTNYLEFGGVTG